MEIVPKALGGPEKLDALVYKGNHTASFKSEHWDKWSQPSALLLQPEVVGTWSEEAAQPTAGETSTVLEAA